MWLLMNIGEEPFFLDSSGQLTLRFRPVLSSKFFTKNQARKTYSIVCGEDKEILLPAKSYSFLFLGRTLVTYLNPLKKNTYGPKGVRSSRIALFDNKGLVVKIDGDVVSAPYAQLIRDCKIERIEILLGA